LIHLPAPGGKWQTAMTLKPLKTQGLIPSPSRDEAKIACFFGSLLYRAAHG
jgi:hypothetical protein